MAYQEGLRPHYDNARVLRISLNHCNAMMCCKASRDLVGMPSIVRRLHEKALFRSFDSSKGEEKRYDANMVKLLLRNDGNFVRSLRLPVFESKGDAIWMLLKNEPPALLSGLPEGADTRRTLEGSHIIPFLLQTRLQQIPSHTYLNIIF